MIWSVVTLLLGVALIVWGAESFAEHLAAASARLGVSAFALAVLLAGAEPEELATAVTAAMREAPAVAFGDVIGANTAICLVALGVGAWIAPLPFPPRVMRYAASAVVPTVLCVSFGWDGRLGRIEGAVLVLAYLAYVAWIWRVERGPPALGEVGEIEEAREEMGAAGEGGASRVGRELVMVMVGVGAIVAGSSLLVAAVERLTHSEHDQARFSLTAVGFATAFELVVLAWSSARRGISEAVVAAVVGSYAYNVTMTIGAAAVVAPLRMVHAEVLHVPSLAMVASLALVIGLARTRRGLDRRAANLLLATYLLCTAAFLTV